MWEYDPSLNRFGTTESLMLLPYWTNGCIDSMEGLLFESSHDNAVPLPQPERALRLALRRRRRPSLHRSQRPARHPPSPAVGRAVLPGLVSLDVESAASADPNAVLIDQTGPWDTSYNGEIEDTTWKVYRIKDTPLVTPLANQPVVWQGVQASQKSWLPPAVSWYDDPSRWDVVPAAAGPADWTRVPIGDRTPTAVPEPPTRVTAVRQTDDSVSFHVDRIGTPVEVKISYFPNWQASGADGPWRVAPNLMVVVPTAHDVTLRYGTTTVDHLGQLVTLLALAAAIVLGTQYLAATPVHPCRSGSRPALSR